MMEERKKDTKLWSSVAMVALLAVGGTSQGFAHGDEDEAPGLPAPAALPAPGALGPEQAVAEPASLEDALQAARAVMDALAGDENAHRHNLVEAFDNELEAWGDLWTASEQSEEILAQVLERILEFNTRVQDAPAYEPGEMPLGVIGSPRVGWAHSINGQESQALLEIGPNVGLQPAQA